MAFETILLDVTGGIATLTLNRPNAMNAINAKLAGELKQALEEVASNREVRVLVIKGSGPSFCVGGDLREMSAGIPPAQAVDFITVLGKATLALVNMQMPVIAAVHGLAVGAGCNLALSADLIIAAEGSKFGQGFMGVGLVPDAGGTYLLPRLVGMARAKELALTMKRLDATEAERIGLINRVVPADQLEATVSELANSIAAGPAVALRLTKAALNASLGHDLASALEYETAAQALCLQTEDHREGARAFLEKRPPKFTGR